MPGAVALELTLEFLKVGKQGSRESQTLGQEVDLWDDFLAQFSSAGNLNSETTLGQRRNMCFGFF